eukprot:TRINITY_DN6013_c0_g1_i3.p1 TRINITY_DN6013_c0_g1~~TRINITY_DN6013_c0_g1_i3.p1  ORF type:complete len:877 (+),score=173.62 TRINITY_DN6013_c0_g1_i3:168-2633(+)
MPEKGTTSKRARSTSSPRQCSRRRKRRKQATVELTDCGITESFAAAAAASATAASDAASTANGSAGKTAESATGCLRGISYHADALLQARKAVEKAAALAADCAAQETRALAAAAKSEQTSPTSPLDDCSDEENANATAVAEKLAARLVEIEGMAEDLAYIETMHLMQSELVQDVTRAQGSSMSLEQPETPDTTCDSETEDADDCSDASGEPTEQQPEDVSEASAFPVYATNSKIAGVTPPMSYNEPTEHDFLLTKHMIAQLDAEFPQETPEGMEHREAVLDELNEAVRRWLTDMGMKEGMQEEAARNSAFKIVTLGSYRLGVVQPTSDIDALCIGPPYVSREAFSEILVERLKRYGPVVDCVSMPDTFTPIIKLHMRGISIDLSFARLVDKLSPVPRTEKEQEEMLKRDEILQRMDEKSVRCVNAFRVADHILELVPNRETFRQTLRFVKYWARQRGIYSSVLGFFGGIAWALMVARVCQLYPNFCASQMVNRFFRVFDMWDCPRPVMLCEIKDPQTVPGMTSVKVWNPKTNPADRLHVMAVITPTFPSINVACGVTETTKRILLDEFKRGFEVLRGIEKSSIPASLLPAVARSVEEQTRVMRELQEPFPYFERFFHFLWLEMLAKSQEVFLKWNAFVESRLRVLMKHLEIPKESTRGMIIHPNPEQYDVRLFGGHGDLLMSTRPDDNDWPFGSGMFTCLAFIKDYGAAAGQTVDLRPACIPFMEAITQWAEMDRFGGQICVRLKRIKTSPLPKKALENAVGSIAIENEPEKKTIENETGKKRPRKERKADASGNANKKPRMTDETAKKQKAALPASGRT